MYSFVHLDHGSLTCSSFDPFFQLPVTSPLSVLGGVLLLFLMLPWFDGVSYVFNFCSYVLGRCSGWAPMHFDGMDHLPYRHPFFCSYFGCSLPCLINQLFRLSYFMQYISSNSFLFSFVCLLI